MKPPLDFSFDCLVSLATWKILGKAGTSIAQYRVTPTENFRLRRFSMDACMVYENVIECVYDQFVPPLQPGSRVLDVGAHIGSFSIHLARRFPKLHILSFEPHPITYQLLTENISLNGLQVAIQTFQVGIGGNDGTSRLYIDNGNTGGNSTVMPIHANPNHVPIHLTSLPTVFAKNAIKQCALLKLDCEGAEYDILTRAPDGLLRKITTIIMETHPGYSVSSLVRRLKKAGFRVRIVANGFTHPLLKHIFTAPLCFATR
ncbi:FkbM family methyltransferase [Candidatus Gottesmanbacteria bacterium]|nr:FkbM family methyltransferase [Candidatus Gottesmanbacteria bacterium]